MKESDQMPKISVIVPVYCVERYIKQCAESLFKQTLLNLEFIFINDCTTDKSIDILKECLEDYPERKSQTIIIDLDSNGGVLNARDIGFKAATGDYIVSCDSDDYVREDAYEKMLRLMLDNDCDIVMCNVEYVGDVTDARLTSVKPWKPDPEAKNNIRSLLRREGLVNSVVWSKMVRSNIVKDDRVYKPIYDFAEDVPYSIQWYALASKIGFVDEPLYYYRLRGDSQGAPDKLIKCNINLCRNINDIKLFLKKQKLYDEMYADIMWFHKFQETLFRSVGTSKILQVWRVNTRPLLSLIWMSPNKSLYRKFGETVKSLFYLLSSFRI